MKYTESFIKTLRETPKDADNASAALLLRGGFISREMSGAYSLLPLGFMAVQNICHIIREEMNNIGGVEISLPSLQPKELWEESGRWNKMDPPLFKLKDRHDKELALGSTHEEVMVDLVRGHPLSWRELPLCLYQIQTKFRNELRSTGGLLRLREFLMKDAYSFHATAEELEKYYGRVVEAYNRIFKRSGLEITLVEAHSGSIGGKKSNEFMVLSPSGEDRVYLCGACDYSVNAELVTDINDCPQCGGEVREERAIEIGHIFALGDLYSDKMKATFTDQDGKMKPYLMGCYGIGIERLLGTVVEINHDEKGIVWPEEVAPAQAYLIDLEGSKGAEVYQKLRQQGIEVLYDDREVAAGVKFADADLIGLPYRLVISPKTLKDNNIEVKKRATSGGEKLLSIDKISTVFNNEKK